MAESGSVTEKRKDKRYVVHDLDVQRSDNGEKLGRVVNLSRGGMLITHKSTMEINSVLPIRIPLTHSKDGLSDFDVDVRVKWFNRKHISGLVGFGFEFVDKSEEKLETLQRIIDEFKQNKK
jgi:c-di-GMP-binding flagellar brake protein YcgR